MDLVPAFPLDGGRIAGRPQWQVTGGPTPPPVRGRIGHVISYLMIGFGVFLGSTSTTC